MICAQVCVHVCVRVRACVCICMRVCDAMQCKMKITQIRYDREIGRP